MCYNVSYVLYCVVLCHLVFTLYSLYSLLSCLDKRLPLARLPPGTRPFRTWIFDSSRFAGCTSGIGNVLTVASPWKPPEGPSCASLLMLCYFMLT